MLAAALVAVASLMRGYSPASAHHLCSATGSPYGAFDILTYEAADYRNLYARTLELGGINALFPEHGGFAAPRVETGGRDAGSGQTADPYIPPLILKAIAFNESGWAQASYDPLVNYGEVGPVLSSHDCGYGLMQVTTGMQNVSGVPSLEQAMIGSHYAFNVARGVKILAEKWNMSPELRPIVGARDPGIIENWYYAVWGYNGFAYQNHPLNPSYQTTRAPYSCGPSNDGFGHDRSQYPYQELIMGCVQRPPYRAGAPLWEPQEVHLPDLNDPQFWGPLSINNWNPCSYSAQCASMDIPTPNANHRDPTAITLTREQVLGTPALSADDISLTVLPPATSAQATLTVSNPGSGVLAFRATSNSSWLRIASPPAGVALGADLGGATASVLTVVDTAGLPPGVHTAQVNLESMYSTSSGRAVNVTVATSPTLTDGQIVRGSGAEVYLLAGGLRRHIPNVATFSALGLQWQNLVTVSDAILSQYPLGNPMFDVTADGLLVRGSGPAVYVLQGGQLRHVTSPEAMSACFFSFGSVSAYSDGVLDSLAEGPPLSGAPCPRFAPRDGTLLRGSGAAVYVVQGGIKRHVPNLLTFEVRRYRFENVDAVQDAVLSLLATGHPLVDIAVAGNLIGASGRPEVYVIQGGAKRHVAGLEVMSACGYGFDSVNVISAGTVDGITSSPALTGPPCPIVLFAPRSLLAGSGPAIYAIDANGQRRHIPNPEAFAACGYLWGNVDVVADSTLQHVSEGPPLTSGTCP